MQQAMTSTPVLAAERDDGLLSRAVTVGSLYLRVAVRAPVVRILLPAGLSMDSAVVADQRQRTSLRLRAPGSRRSPARERHYA